MIVQSCNFISVAYRGKKICKVRFCSLSWFRLIYGSVSGRIDVFILAWPFSSADDRFRVPKRLCLKGGKKIEITLRSLGGRMMDIPERTNTSNGTTPAP